MWPKKSAPHERRIPRGPNKFSKIIQITGLQINLYLEQPMEIQLFATFFQRRKRQKRRLTF
jgi:hypothetical protein